MSGEVQKRWRLPPQSPFYAVPERALFLLSTRPPLEERIMHRVLAAWRWGDGPTARVSAAHIAKLTKGSRRSVMRALRSLAEHGLVDMWEGSQGIPPEVSIAPFITRVMAHEPVAERHRLIARRKTNAKVAEPVAGEHMHLSPEGTGEEPLTCALPASGVCTQRKEPKVPKRAREAAGGLRGGHASRASRGEFEPPTTGGWAAVQRYAARLFGWDP